MSLFTKLFPIEYKCVVLSKNQGHISEDRESTEGIIVKREGQEASQGKKRHFGVCLTGCCPYSILIGPFLMFSALILT